MATVDLLRPEPYAPAPAAARRAVVRSSLVNRLCAADDVPVVTVVAPAGYGKTTLLGQWAERDRRPCAWISLTPEDDDPDAVEAFLAPALEEELLAIIDDAHLLRSPDGLDSLQRALEHVAPGTTVAIAGRIEPPLPLGRLRAEGRLLEVGAEDLALKEREVRSVLRHTGVLLPSEDVAELAERTEGWPATTTLAALALRAGVPVTGFGGDDRFVSDYLETEHLAALSPPQRRFAVQASVLEELSAPACDALLGRRDSGRVLSALERAGLVVPLDHCDRRYRYRRLVRDLLRAELDRTAPERARALHAAASVWSEEHDDPEHALRHAAAAGEPRRVAALAERFLVPECERGRFDRVEPWLELLHDEPAIERHPDLCLAASWLHALRGRAPESQHWADAAARALDGGDPRLHVLRALRCRDGVAQMLDDTAIALSALPAGDAWRTAALLASGAARFLTADAARAEHDLGDAVEAADAAGAAAIRILGLCMLALFATERDAPAEAEAFLNEARTAAAANGPDVSAAQVLLEAVTARAAIRDDDRATAEAAAARAGERLSFLSHAAPWLSTLAALELVHVRLGLADADGARELLRRVGDILRLRPQLGLLVRRTAELDRRARALAEPEGRWASSLTPAETRLLPLLATHLSFREIGERLYVSRNTVKTQAISVYRKFGVSSRSDAIARALELGLIDESRGVWKAG